MVIGKTWQNIQFVDNMKNKKYSKTVKDWFIAFTSCYGNIIYDDNETESFYNAGFDDGAGWVCSAMKEAGIPMAKIAEVYASLDPKGESLNYQMIMEEWLEEDMEAVA